MDNREDNEVNFIIGQNIAKRRESLSLNQAELAKRTGLTAKSISEIERGKAQPRKKNLVAIASALNCNVSDFFKDDPDSTLQMAIKIGAETSAHHYNMYIEETKKNEVLQKQIAELKANLKSKITLSYEENLIVSKFRLLPRDHQALLLRFVTKDNAYLDEVSNETALSILYELRLFLAFLLVDKESS